MLLEPKLQELAPDDRYRASSPDLTVLEFFTLPLQHFTATVHPIFQPDISPPVTALKANWDERDTHYTFSGEEMLSWSAGTWKKMFVTQTRHTYLRVYRYSGVKLLEDCYLKGNTLEDILSILRGDFLQPPFAGDIRTRWGPRTNGVGPTKHDTCLMIGHGEKGATRRRVVTASSPSWIP